ncbi:MAG: YfhO family protein [Bacteroidetes bacterium]|nr:YfhO family protein [Bacteroidota bacterium]
MSTKKTATTRAETVKPAATTDLYQTLLRGKELYWLLAIILVVCYIVFKDFIHLKKVYLFRDIGSDSINIYFPWLTCVSDYLKHDSAPGWSFSQGMGQNIFPIWLGDFFSDALVYFDKSKIPYGLAFMEIIKIFLSGFVFYKFLKELKLSNFSSLIFSLLYAFSGFMIVGGSWVIFSIEALYIAIILYGFERWLNHRKYFWFVTGVMMLSFLQPFLLLPYTIVLAAYITARYFDMSEPKWKEFAVFLSKTVGLAAIGVAMSAYQLLPDILQYLESPRVGGESTFFEKLKQQETFGLADELLRFTTTFRAFGSDMLGTGNNFRGWQNYLEAPLFYCGIFCLVAFPQFFPSLTKRQKYFYGIITGFFCLPIFFPYFRYAFWAFSGDYFRTFSLVIILFMVMFSARAVHFIEQKGKINKIVLAVTVVILLILLYTPAAQYKQAVNTGLRSMVTFLILAYGGLLFGLSSKGFSSVSKILLLVLCVFEMAYTSNTTVNKRDTVTAAILHDKVGYNDYSVDAVAYLKQTDKSFFRVNKDYSSGLAMHASINDAKVQGYFGTSSYYSFNQKNYIKFLGDFDVINVKDENSTRWAKGLVDRPILFSLASGKYWLSKRTDNAIASMGFDSIQKFGDVKVYKNRYSLPFGFTYSKRIGEEAFKKLSPTQKDFCALRACVVPKEDATVFSSMPEFNLADTTAAINYDNYGAYVNELKKDQFSMTKFTENNFGGTIQVNEPKALFFSFPFDEGWTATVNNAETKLYRLNSGLTGLMLNKGANTVELKFVPRLKHKGAMISLIAFVLFGGLLGLTFYRSRKTVA